MATVTIADVYAKPPKVSGVSAGTASDGSLRISWEAPEASPALTQQFVQHRRDDKPDGDWTRQEVSASATEALVTGLQPGRRYDVRVRARNKVGKSGWSDEATANTAPTVSLSAEDGGVASIGEGNGSARIRLTGSAKAKGGGSLTGQWLAVYPNPNHGVDEIARAWGQPFSMESKRDYERRASSDSPAERTYRLRVTHLLSGDSAIVDRDVVVRWLPKVVLGVSPSSVPEDGGARTVSVEARLTGRTIPAWSQPVSVKVKVKGGTATEGTDFASVGNFTVSIPGGSRSASGSFTLTPTADAASEGGETVKVKGSATQGSGARERELKSRDAEVTIEDERFALTISPTPSNGSVTGTGIACGTGTSGDCSETVTKSASVSLSASPASGYVFKEWSGACASEKGASCAVVVSGATTAGASFRRPKLKVKVSPAAGGSVTGSGIDCGSGTTDDCSEKVSGGSLALTASPASGYAVSAWSGGGCSGTGTACAASVTADTTVTVTFERRTRPTLTVSPTPANGSVTGTGIACGAGTSGDCEETVDRGTKVTLTASPAANYAVQSWSGGGCTGTGTTCEVEVTANTTVGVTFAKPTLTVSPAPTNGSLLGTGISCGAGTTGDCSETVNAGTSLTLTATPATNYAVGSWSGGGCAGTGTTCEVTVNADTTVGVTFAKPTLTVSPAPANGSVAGTGISCGAGTTGDCSETVNAGTSVTLTASPGANYAVKSWSGGCSGTATTCTVEVNADTTVGVTFSKPTLTVSPAPANGSVSGTGVACGAGTSGDCEETVNSGTRITLTATPSANYAVGSWSGGGCSGTGTTCQVTVNADTTVAVTFAKPTLTVSPAPTNGSVAGTGISCGAGTTGDCSETVNSGTSVALTAAPGSGYVVKEWGGACSGTGTSCTVAVDSDRTASVAFKLPDVFTVKVSPKPTGGHVSGNGLNCGSGSGRTACSASLAKDTNVSLTATAASGRRFGSWTGCPASTTTAACAFKLSANATLGARFIEQFALTVSRSPSAGGTVSGSVVSGDGTVVTSGVVSCGSDCGETVDSGTKVKLTAAASSGYRFKDWTGCDSASGSVCTQTLGSAETVTANFVRQFALTVSRSPSAGGTVSGSVVSGDGTVLTSGVVSCGSDCAETVDTGTKVKLTAAASSGYRFKDWTGCDSASGSVCTQTLGSAETVTANFVQRHTLTVGRMKHAGYVTGGGVNCGAGTGRSQCSVTLDRGTAVTLTATAHNHYLFNKWLNDCSSSGTSSTCSLVMNGDRNVRTSFWVLYTLSVSPRPSNGGYVTGSGISCGQGRTDCDTEDKLNTKVRLTATAAPGFRLRSWSGCAPSATDGAGQCTATISGNKTVVANFVRRHTLSAGVSPSGGGKVTGTVTNSSGETTVIDCGTDCSEVVDASTSVKLAASPTAGYVFGTWTGCDSANGSACTQTVNANETVTANFIQQHTLSVTVSPDAGGKATGGGINCGGAASGTKVCSKKFNHSLSVTLEGAAAGGYRFTGWGGACTGTGSCTVVMNASKSVTAGFKKEHKLEIKPRPTNGYVTGTGINCGAGTSRTDCTELVLKGTSVSLAATSNTGYQFGRWSGCPAGVATSTPCTFTMERATTVGASFEKKTHTLTVTKSSKGYATWATHINCGSGTGRTDCTETVDHGTSLSLAATPNAGYKLKDWTCSSGGSPCPPAKMTSDLTVTPNFETSLTVNAGGPYQAIYHSGTPTPFNFGPYYTASVLATAQGGKPTYEYQWQGSVTGTTWSTSGRGSYFFFFAPTTSVPASTTVTVEVRDANRETASADATINFGSAGGASGQSSSALPVPLGGELLLVWGGEGTVAASSQDSAVAAVRVDGPLLVVSGVSVGETGIVVEIGSERIRVAVEVGG